MAELASMGERFKITAVSDHALLEHALLDHDVNSIRLLVRAVVSIGEE